VFNPTRDQSRQFLFETWRKYRAGEALGGLEGMALEHILKHPEYHAMLGDPDRYQDREYPPELGETNPFLHLMMHLALSEQLSIDQPTGIKARFERLAARLGDSHAAQHETLDCLAEMIWRAQRDGTPPDGVAYLDCLERKRG
jgi:hypothetical protein